MFFRCWKVERFNWHFFANLNCHYNYMLSVAFRCCCCCFRFELCVLNSDELPLRQRSETVRSIVRWLFHSFACSFVCAFVFASQQRERAGPNTQQDFNIANDATSQMLNATLRSREKTTANKVCFENIDLDCK